MTAPPRQPRARKATKPAPPAPSMALVPASLAPDEKRLVQRYRDTAEVWRSDIVAYANTSAIMFPVEAERAKAPPPGIRLATDAGKKVPK